MLMVDRDKAKKKEMLLIQFKGFLPMEILNSIDTTKRNDYLERVGLYDEVMEENLIFRQNFKRYGLKYKQKTLEKWADDNPQFKDLIVEVED